MKKRLLFIVPIVIASAYLITAYTYHQNSDVEKFDGQLGNTVGAMALQVSGWDAGTLENIADQLQSTCAKNKYELTEAECVQAIKDHKDICMRVISERFPGQPADSARQQMIVANYVDCLFQQ